MEIALLVGFLLVCFAAFPLGRSKRVPDNVVQFVPKSTPPKTEIRAAGQVIEFPQKGQSR
jgi:hypothetical protein